ncbi:MAG: TolC family protein, partial [Candidatus Eremiobacterota bacterium]
SEPPDLAAALDRAARARPELASARLAAERARMESDLEGRQRIPDLELSAYRSTLYGTAQDGVQLALVLPLWDWGRIGAAAEQRELEAEALEYSREARRQELLQELRAAWLRHQGARARRDRLRAQVERWLTLSGMARKGFDAGLLTLLEVLDAQRSYREALQDYVAAEAAYHRTRLEVYLLSGGALEGKKL